MMRRAHGMVAAVVVFAAVAALAGTPAGQNLGTLGTGVAGETTVNTPVRFVPPTGPAPRLPNGKPDFSGVWDHAYVPDMSASNIRNLQTPDGCRATALHAGRSA